MEVDGKYIIIINTIIFLNGPNKAAEPEEFNQKNVVNFPPSIKIRNYITSP